MIHKCQRSQPAATTEDETVTPCVHMDEKQLMKECKNSLITKLEAPFLPPCRWVKEWMHHYPIKYEQEFMSSHLGLWAQQSLLNSSAWDAIPNGVSAVSLCNSRSAKTFLFKCFTWTQMLESHRADIKNLFLCCVCVSLSLSLSLSIVLKHLNSDSVPFNTIQITYTHTHTL